MFRHPALALLKPWALPWTLVLILLTGPGTANAVPSFARQTGMQCAACHTVFPELNSFGRQFKLRAFTLGTANADADFPGNVPMSLLLQITRTATDKAGIVDPEMLPRDREIIPQAVGIYYAGRISERTGALAQVNYDGIERKWATEMIDMRFADSTTVAGERELLYGFTINNSPTVTDVLNSVPMWSFPHVDPAGLMPAASTLLDMQLSSQVGGVTAYGLFDNLIYGEVGFYGTARTGLLRPLGWGNDKTLVVDGYAPYWRLALQRDFGAHSVSAGLLGLNARIWLDPNDRSMSTDRFRDTAFDAQYQYHGDVHSFSSHLIYLHERQNLRASLAQGMAENAGNTLRTTRIDAHYFYQRTVGGGVQWFATRGDADAMRYGMGPVMGSASGKPDNTGWIAELNYLPLQNVKLALRRTAYQKFNGASRDYDGSGRNASDNNNWFLMGWFMF